MIDYLSTYKKRLGHLLNVRNHTACKNDLNQCLTSQLKKLKEFRSEFLGTLSPVSLHFQECLSTIASLIAKPKLNQHGIKKSTQTNSIRKLKMSCWNQWWQMHQRQKLESQSLLDHPYLIF
nr:putative F-box/LRR-repeat protein 23 [Tanacetum cinerariifolium]